MRWPTLWRGGAAMLAAAALTIDLSGAVWADDDEQEVQTEQSVEQDTQEQAGQPVRITMSVTENRAPGLTGTLTLTPLGNNQARVEVRVTGLPPNDVARPWHIHTAPGARCDTGAPVTYPFPNATVDANGVATSTATVTLTPDRPVTANNAYINFHDPKPPLNGLGVICADITFDLLAFANRVGAAAQPAPAAQRPAAAPAAARPAAQRPAAAPAAAAPRPAAAPAVAAAQRPATAPAALPRTGTGGMRAEESGAWALGGLGLAMLLLGGSGVLAVARRRR